MPGGSPAALHAASQGGITGRKKHPASRDLERLAQGRPDGVEGRAGQERLG